MKTQAKNEKITPIKQENTLLDEALSKAENAIFGEVIDNPEKGWYNRGNNSPKANACLKHKGNADCENHKPIALAQGKHKRLGDT